MEIIAVIISGIITLEGLIALFIPGKAAEVSEEFSRLESGLKRVLGIFLLAAGAVLFFLTRIYLALTLVHWIVAVYGIFLVLTGLFLALLPSPAGRMLAWFYSEKSPVQLIGFILSGAGITLLILI